MSDSTAVASALAHKLIWGAVSIVVLAVVIALSRVPAPAARRPTPKLAAEQVVVGELPGEPRFFVAREAVDRLAAAAEPGRAAVVCAVTGQRGVGKTQIAAAFARRCVAAGWHLVGWVNAETTDTLLAGLARVADAAGAGDPDGDSQKSAERLRDYLAARADPTLLVFDNAADPDALRRFLPAAGGARVVVTSTSQAFAA